MNPWIILFSLIELFFLAVGVWLVRRLWYMRLERNRLRQEKEIIYSFIHDVGDIFAEDLTLDLERMIKRVLSYALRTTRATAGAVYLMNKDEQTLSARAVSGLFPPIATHQALQRQYATSRSQYIEQLVRSQPLQRDEGLLREVSDEGLPLLIEDATWHPSIPVFDDPHLRINTLLAVPMMFQHQVIGLVVVINRSDSESFSVADRDLLQALADQASVSVHFSGFRRALQDKERLDRDLSIARQIQASLLPSELPHVPGYNLAAQNSPALEIGGDYYDVLPVDEEHMGLMIADVSGKGVTGGIIMTICRSVFHTRAVGCLDPCEVLREVGKVVSSELAADLFVSMLYMVLNTTTGELRIARAGHERPIVYKSSEQDFLVVDSPGIACGLVDDETFTQLLSEVSITLQPGDVVVAYTDGITEAMNSHKEEWGVNSLLKAVKDAHTLPASGVLSTILDRAHRFIDGAPQYDDMTLLVLKAF